MPVSTESSGADTAGVAASSSATKHIKSTGNGISLISGHRKLPTTRAGAAVDMGAGTVNWNAWTGTYLFVGTGDAVYVAFAELIEGPVAWPKRLVWSTSQATSGTL